MKQSTLLLQTYREAPRDADVVSQQLMMRAGMIQKLAAGIYDYLPLALRSIRKFENIVRQELARDGCQELLMPTVQPRAQNIRFCSVSAWLKPNARLCRTPISRGAG